VRKLDTMADKDKAAKYRTEIQQVSPRLSLLRPSPCVFRSFILPCGLKEMDVALVV
jgi:hypothetical protein